MIEYRGYYIAQAVGYNNHISILRTPDNLNGIRKAHIQCSEPKTDEELRQILDEFLERIEDFASGDFN